MGRKGTFVRYCENSKAFRIYFLGQGKVEISRDVTFDAYVALGKVRGLLPPPPLEKKNDDMDNLAGPSMLESKRDIIEYPMEPMDPLDPPSCDLPIRKKPLWLHDKLQDDERCVLIRRSFRESKKPCMY